MKANLLVAILCLSLVGCRHVQPVPASALNSVSDIPQTRTLIVVDFWASFCSFCAESFPRMDQLYLEYAPKGLDMIAISIDEDPEAAQSFVDAHQPHFAVGWDSYHGLADRYDVRTLPTTLVIDQNGEVVARFNGASRRQFVKLEQFIAKHFPH